MSGTFIIAGNKGGVCKSTVSMLMADYVIRRGQAERLLCGDAEMTELQRTFGTQMRKSGLVDPGWIRAYDFMSDAGVEAFVDDVSGLAGYYSIIDTGANLQKHLLGQAGFLADCAGDMNGEITIVFIVSPAEESAAALQDFMLSAGGRFRIRVVLIGPEDIPAGEYALLKNDLYSGTRMVLEKKGCPIHFIGQIPERFFQLMMRDERKLPARILEDLEGKAMRRRFLGWLNERVDPVMGEILGVEDA